MFVVNQAATSILLPRFHSSHIFLTMTLWNQIKNPNIRITRASLNFTWTLPSALFQWFVFFQHSLHRHTHTLALCWFFRLVYQSVAATRSYVPTKTNPYTIIVHNTRNWQQQAKAIINIELNFCGGFSFYNSNLNHFFLLVWHFVLILRTTQTATTSSISSSMKKIILA